MVKPSSPKHLARLIDRLAPALRRLQGTGSARGNRIALLGHLADGGAQTMRALATHLHVTPQAVTGLVDELEAEGLLARERHPVDRRKTIIRLSDHASDRVKAARDARADDLSELFADIPKGDRAAFARVAQTLLDRLE